MRKFKVMPVYISPFFWVGLPLIMWYYLFLGGRQYPLFEDFLLMGEILIVLLLYELGHALVAYYFGQKPLIVIHLWGGETLYDTNAVQGWQELLITLGGLLSWWVFGWSLALIGLAISNSFLSKNIDMIIRIYEIWLWIKCLPLIPMDGGHLILMLLRSIFKAKGVKCAIIMSMMGSVGCALFFGWKQFGIGVFFVLCAFRSYNMWQEKRAMTNDDCNKVFVREFVEIKKVIAQEGVDAAFPRLEEFYSKVKNGMLFNLTSQYLASVKIKNGELAAVYEILEPIYKYLCIQAKVWLFYAAYEMQDYSLVMKLSGPCFRNQADLNITLRSAAACATLNQHEAAIGWLIAAYKAKCKNLRAFLSKEMFHSMRNLPEFIQLYKLSNSQTGDV